MTYPTSNLDYGDGVASSGVGGGSDADVAGYIDDPASDTTTALAAQYVASDDVREIVELTQAAYDALDPVVATTLYVIVG